MSEVPLFVFVPPVRNAHDCRVWTETEFYIDNLLVRIHFIIEMIWWTGLVPWEFAFHACRHLPCTHA